MLRLSPQKIPPGRLTCLMAAALCAVPVLAAERVDIPGYEARAGAQYRYRVQKTTETDMSSLAGRAGRRAGGHARGFPAVGDRADTG